MKVDRQYYAIFDDGHHRQFPRLVSGPFKYQTYAYDNFKLSQPFATKLMKVAVIPSSMMYLTYPLNGEVPGYPKEEFEKDLVDECLGISWNFITLILIAIRNEKCDLFFSPNALRVVRR